MMFQKKWCFVLKFFLFRNLQQFRTFFKKYTCPHFSIDEPVQDVISFVQQKFTLYKWGFCVSVGHEENTVSFIQTFRIRAFGS